MEEETENMEEYKDKFHIDYYTEELKVVHDGNKYVGIMDAINMINQQIEEIMIRHPIKKIEINTWQEAHPEMFKKQNEEIKK